MNENSEVNQDYVENLCADLENEFINMLDNSPNDDEYCRVQELLKLLDLLADRLLV